MKSKFLKPFALTLLAASLVSCGGSDNKKNDNNNSLASQGFNSVEEANTVNNVKSSLNCPSGRRLTQDYVYNVRFQGNHTTICGTPQQGAMGGQTGQIYVGVSAYNDIMTVTEVVSGNSVIGHNIRLSMCSQYMQTQVGNLPLIADERPLSGFQIPRCIVLDKDNFCPHGVVDAAYNTYQVAAPYQYQYNGMQGQLNPFEVWTTFFKPGCNQNY